MNTKLFRQKGFTLLEFLLAIGLSTLLITILTGVSIRSMKSLAQQNKNQKLLMQAVLLESLVTAHFESALSLSLSQPQENLIQFRQLTNGQAAKQELEYLPAEQRLRLTTSNKTLSTEKTLSSKLTHWTMRLDPETYNLICSGTLAEAEKTYSFSFGAIPIAYQIRSPEKTLYQGPTK